MKIAINFFCVTILALIGACADKKTYDKTKAISAFAIVNEIKVDEALEKTEIKTPPQISNENWPLSSKQNVENFAFVPQKPSKFLNESSQIWSGYRPFLADRFVFAPIIQNNKIFVLDASGKLFAYDFATKNQLWKKRLFPRKYLKNYQNPKIGFFDNKIFAIAGSNQIVAANSDNGEILWSKTILSLPISTPISDGKSVYFTTSDNKTYALEASSGKLEWVSSGVNKNTAIFGASSPLIYNDLLLVSYSSGEIYALRKNTGEPLWSQDLNINKAGNSDFYLNDIDASLVIKNDVVYAIGNGGLMMAINLKNGKYIWKKEIAGITDFWLAGEFLYVINNDDKLIALESKKGGIKWISQLPNFKKEKNPATKIIYNGIIMVGGKLVICDSRGKLLVANPFDGKIEQNFNIGQKISHSPAFVNGKIYLHALDFLKVNLIEVW